MWIQGETRSTGIGISPLRIHNALVNAVHLYRTLKEKNTHYITRCLFRWVVRLYFFHHLEYSRPASYPFMCSLFTALVSLVLTFSILLYA